MSVPNAVSPAGTRWTDLVVFSILIVFMIARPQGLLGRPDIKKV